VATISSFPTDDRYQYTYDHKTASRGEHLMVVDLPLPRIEKARLKNCMEMTPFTGDRCRATTHRDFVLYHVDEEPFIPRPVSRSYKPTINKGSQTGNEPPAVPSTCEVRILQLEHLKRMIGRYYLICRTHLTALPLQLSHRKSALSCRLGAQG
jgi:hypothetical protein